MNVYRNLALVGIAMKNNALYMALRITSVKKVKDWDTCSNLMFGNLVCISISGTFQQPIWATVTDRDMSKKDSIVIVQSCLEWNDNDDAEILLNLITAKGYYLILSLQKAVRFRAVSLTVTRSDKLKTSLIFVFRGN